MTTNPEMFACLAIPFLTVFWFLVGFNCGKHFSACANLNENSSNSNSSQERGSFRNAHKGIFTLEAIQAESYPDGARPSCKANN